MNKIFVTGAIGSGKSYLSKYISQKTNIPITALDEIVFDLKSEETRKKHDDITRDKLLFDTLKLASSIYEGWHFGKWLIPMYEIIDTVIIVDTSLENRILRINKRFENRKLGIETDPFPSAGIDHLDNLLKWTRLWNEDQVLNEIQSFSKLTPNVFKVKSVDDIDLVLHENLPNKSMHRSRPL